MHPDRVGIDRAIATGSASFRDIAKLHGVTVSAISRHVAQHWGNAPTTAVSTAATVAQEVVQAVRDQQDRDRRQTESVWMGRLHKTYADASTAYNHAINDPEGIDAAAKMLMVQARLCDTGLRADGILAGGGETRVTVNVEQLVILPSPPDAQRRLQPADAIDVSPAE
jgi:transposase-like protein